jgi:hypothetical protein
MRPPARSALFLATALLSGCSGVSSPLVAAAPRRAATPPVAPSIGPSVVEGALAIPQDAAAPALAKSTGDAAKATPPPDTRPRLGATGPFAYIYKKPSKSGLALGYIRMGTAVPLRQEKPVVTADCPRGWYAVEPRGYACLNFVTTLDLADPYYLALKSAAPAADAVWYYRYAFSNSAPMYSRLPTKEETAREDQKFGPRGSYSQLAEWSKGHEELLIADPFVATDPVPEIFAGGKKHIAGGTHNPEQLLWRTIPNGSMVAVAKAFEADGRVWLMTPDLMLVPADRVRQMKRSTFHGVDLGSGVELPLAWNRTKGMKPKYRKQDGKMVAFPDAIPPKTWIQVTEETVTDGGKTYLAVRGEADTFVAEDDVTVSVAKKGLPRGVEPGQKWIEAKILPGTMTLYEGEKPVRASLFSPGKGGVPVPGLDNTKYATTQMGYFPIEWKDHVATMSNEKSVAKLLWFTDVPHIQYLRAPLAMHVAYWHEDFGNPKSAECVNISPEDGHFLFNWTEPGLPEGWGAIRPGDGNGRSTPVIITAK